MESFIKNFTFKQDKYSKRRGAPCLLKITCSSCHQLVMYYQKDGPGPLKRCYLDRIMFPEILKQLQYSFFDEKKCPALRCFFCWQLIGIPMIYIKENRPSFNLIPKSFFLQELS